MQTASQPSHDPAPLLWVRGEIEHSLAKARENLDIVQANPGDANAIQSVAADLHQVTGALLMVGLAAAARHNEETEKLVDTFKGRLSADAATRISIAKHSTVSLSKYLDGLVAGKPDRPMELAASYAMLNKALGANGSSPNDLFSPDLSAEAPRRQVYVAESGGELPVEAISRCRGMFQAGVLKLVRDKDLVGGARHMRDAILALETLEITSSSRSFWFSTVGFLDAVANDPVGAGSFAVQLFGKIDQQIKRLLDNDHDVPEKLFRDLLVVIGRSSAHTERMEQIREIYRLDQLLALPDAGTKDKTDEKLKPVIAALRAQIKVMKDDLMLFAGGRTSALAPFIKQAAALAKFGQQLPNQEMVRLLHLFDAVARHFGKTGKRPSETQALEFATALLFVESSLEDYSLLSTQFDQQASRICSRIRNVMTGVELPGFNRSVASLSDTMTLEAQTQLLVFQVGREIRANLVRIESGLDDFFRDATKTAGLADVESLFTEVRGAFSVLDENEAASLVKILGERVAQFASGAVKGEGVESDAVAEGVSALGFYVEGLQQGSPDARAVLLPALISFDIVKKTAPVEELPDIASKKNDILAAEQVATVASNDVDPKREIVGATRQVAERVSFRTDTAIESAEVDAERVTQTPAESPVAEPSQASVESPRELIAVPSNASTVALVVSQNSNAQNELDRLIRSEAQLKAGIEERDHRIRALQAQMVALHKEARMVAALKAELKELRAATKSSHSLN